MSFKVGDKVGFTAGANMGALTGSCRAEVGTITEYASDSDVIYPFTVKVGDKEDDFSAEELRLIAPAVVSPQGPVLDPLSHDYRIGYAAGFFYKVAYVLPKDQHTPNYCAGFSAGIDARHAVEKAGQLAMLVT